MYVTLLKIQKTLFCYTVSTAATDISTAENEISTAANDNSTDMNDKKKPMCKTFEETNTLAG